MNTVSSLDSHSTSMQPETSFDLTGTLSLSERQELLSLLNTSYPDWGVDKVFEDYPCHKDLRVFRLRVNDMLIASRQVLIVENPANAPLWALEIADALSTDHFAIGSRAIVHPAFRGQGLGTKLVHQVNHEAYTRHGVEMIFGSSTSIAAIKLYLRLGAKLWKNDTYKLYTDNSAANITALKNLFTQNNKSLARMQTPVRYVYQNLNNAYDQSSNHYLWSLHTHSSDKKIISPQRLVGYAP